MNGALLVLGLIERTISLAPAVKNLIDRLREGETVTKEEIAQAEAAVNEAAGRWHGADD